MRNLSGLVDARSRYSDVKVPVTLVYSEHDWSRPAERQQVADRLTKVKSITLADAGHFSALERPADMAHILLEPSGQLRMP
jgi:pimeloyl-ACP methyl ester carboxylesterase